MIRQQVVAIALIKAKWADIDQLPTPAATRPAIVNQREGNRDRPRTATLYECRGCVEAQVARTRHIQASRIFAVTEPARPNHLERTWHERPLAGTPSPCIRRASYASGVAVTRTSVAIDASCSSGSADSSKGSENEKATPDHKELISCQTGPTRDFSCIALTVINASGRISDRLASCGAASAPRPSASAARRRR